MGWFVSRITQKLLNRFPGNLDGEPEKMGREQGPTNFWCRSALGDSSKNFFFYHFLTFFVNFSGNNALILMKKSVSEYN